MFKTSLFFLIIVLGLQFPIAFSQEIDPVVRFSETIKAEDLQSHIYFLADDLLEGRETGERGMHLAALYIKTRFMRFGLTSGVPDNGFYQNFFMERTVIEEANMRLGETQCQFRDHFFTFNSSMPDSLEGKLEFVGFGLNTVTYDNLQHAKLKGKIAVAFAGSPTETEDKKRMYDQVKEWSERKEGVENAGAKAMLMIVPDKTYKTISRFARRRSMRISDGKDSGIPLIFVQESAAASLFQKAKIDPAVLMDQLATSDELPKVKLRKSSFKLTAKVDRTSNKAMNVLGYLEGSEKADELLIITGHFDHIGISRKGEVNNGADDDASGTSAVLELAEAFSLAAKAGHRPKRSILFMTVSGEEKGLLGSDFYTEHPIYPLDKTIANLNIDMIGRIGKEYLNSADSSNYIYVIGADKLSSELHSINEQANDQYTQLKLDYKYNDENDPNRFYYRSDHYNFAKNGIPVIFYFNGTHKDYHRPGDDPEKIGYEKAAKVTRLVFATAWELANRDSRIIVDQEGK
ncbi:MAG: M28 family peptidase [Bacteroidota bacterium]